MKKGVPVLFGVIAFFAVFVGLALFVGLREQTVTASQLSLIYAPEYGSIKCDRLPAQAPITKALPTGVTMLECGGVNQYMPGGCKVYMSKDQRFLELISGKIYACSKDASSLNDASCKIIGNTNTIQIQNGDNYLGTIPYEGKVFADVKGQFRYRVGDLTLRLEGERYGLTNVERGRVLLSQDCNLGSLGTDYHPLQPVAKSLTPTDPILNYIIGFTQQINAGNRISFNRQDVYVYAPGCYYPIKKTTDGILYTDVRNGKCGVTAITCMPSTSPLCTSTGSGTKVVASPQGQSCDAILGVGTIDSFQPVDAEKVCKYSCVNGKLAQSECQQRISDCGTDGTKQYDPLTNTCIDVVKTTTQAQVQCRAEGGTWKEKKTTRCADFFCFRTETVEEPYCDKSKWLKITVWVLVAVLVLVLLFVGLRMSAQKGNRRVRR